MSRPSDRLSRPSSGVERSSRPHRRGEALVFVARGVDLGRLFHLEQRAFLQAAAADRVEIGEMRQRFSPVAALKRSISSVAAERLAITPAMRTS